MNLIAVRVSFLHQFLGYAMGAEKNPDLSPNLLGKSPDGLIDPFIDGGDIAGMIMVGRHPCNNSPIA